MEKPWSIDKQTKILQNIFLFKLLSIADPVVIKIKYNIIIRSKKVIKKTINTVICKGYKNTIPAPEFFVSMVKEHGSPATP